MKQWPIALQVYSVREDAQRDFPGTMQRIKDMGYNGVELAGTYGRTAVEIKEILDQVGLELLCAHVGIELLEDDGVLHDYAATGMQYIAIPWLTGPENAQALEATIDRIRAIGERCRKLGMQLLYHNHDFEFEKIHDQYILDTYYQQIFPEFLKTELDVCWIHVGGEDPAQYIRRYSGRAPVVHLKDFTGRKTDDMYGLIGQEETAGGAPKDVFQFRPVGYGKQDIPTIVAAAEQAGAHWLVVEQDMPSMDRTPMECAQLSLQYLRSFL